MQVRLSNEYWSNMDAKLSSVKKAHLSFFFLIVLVVISVFLYFGILYFNQNEKEFGSVNNNPVIKNSIGFKKH